MAYVKHNFKKGDVLTAQALNEMEEQIVINSGEQTWDFTSDYQTELNKVVKAIEDIQNTDKLHTVEFITFSDIHRANTSDHPEFYRMMNAINYLTTKLNIKFVANLGDNYSGYPSEGSTYGKKGVMGIYEEMVDLLSELNAPFININGNHDSVPHVYKRNWITNISNAVFDSVGSWFYLDDDFHNVRFIALDCQDKEGDAEAWTTVQSTGGYADRSWRQLDWLANVALKTNKNIIFLQHQAMDARSNTSLVHPTRTDRYFVAADIINSFKAGTSGNASNGDVVAVSWDFTNQGQGTVLCNFCGHTHGDAFFNANYKSNNSDTSSINEIAIDDALYASATHAGVSGTKTLNTVNEIAFDVVSVDLLNKVVKCHRFGTGDNRACTLNGSMTTFSYA